MENIKKDENKSWLALGYYISIPLLIITIPLKAIIRKKSIRYILVDLGYFLINNFSYSFEKKKR
jgi:hypothetical protein